MSLLRRLTRPLWKEDPGYRKHRRLRQMLMVPVMSFAGFLWGLLAAPSDAGALGWAVGGATAFGALSWLYLHLQPALLQWTEMRLGRGGRWVGALADWTVVGSGIWLVTEVLGLPTFSSVTAAVTLGGLYAGLVVGFWDETGTRLLGGVLGGVQGASQGRIAPPMSHIQSHLARGDTDRARAELELFVEDHPSDPRGWLELARLRAAEDRKDGSEEAVRLLREGLERSRPPIATRQRYVATILEIREAQGAPDRAGRDLSQLAEEGVGTVPGMWAQQELARLRRAATTDEGD